VPATTPIQLIVVIPALAELAAEITLGSQTMAGCLLTHTVRSLFAIHINVLLVSTIIMHRTPPAMPALLTVQAAWRISRMPLRGSPLFPNPQST
jgi:hypothetical protein